MIHVDLPYDYGTFVKVKNEDEKVLLRGTVVAYSVDKDGYLIWVSDFCEPWCGECLPDSVESMNAEEIEMLLKEPHEEKKDFWVEDVE